MAQTHTLDGKFRRVLASFTAKLTQEEADDFSFATLDDLKQTIVEIQEEQGSAKRLLNLGRLSAFLEAMEQYDKVVQIFLNTADLLAFIWGPAKFMLMTASAWVEAFNTLLDAYEEIGEHIPLLKQYEDLIKQSPSLQDILGLIYQDILHFHQKAMRHFRNKVWKQLFHATWKTFRTDFGAVLDHLQAHKRLLDSQTILIGVQETQKAIQERHRIRSEMESEFRSTRALIEAESSRRQADEEKHRRREVYSWLAAADSGEDQERATEVRSEQPTTGRWILQQDCVKAWCNPSSSCEPCLWINGKPGAGKTILASIIVEQCQATPISAFFYCRYEDCSRNTFIGVCRGVLLQLARQDDSVMSYIYERASSSGSAQLNSAALAKELLDVALNTFSSLFIVIDGIDECSKREKEQIVSMFLSMALHHSNLLRCCFISQDDKDTGRLFRGLPTFQITKSHNGGDISEYCVGMEVMIAKSFDICPSDMHRLRIAQKVTEKAAGMFLFAKLVMENLTQQCSRAELVSEIESIPPDLDEAYDRLLVRIFKESPAGEQKMAKKLLCWLLCSQRPLKWHEIQGAMSFNQSNMTFDYKMRHLTKDCKQFCGSLVEVRKGGTIELVHQTARIYLEKQDEIQLPAEDLSFTCLCLQYLMLPSHEEGLPKDTIRQFVREGHYAFTDYATVHWLDHVELTSAGRQAEAGEALNTLNGTIRSFLNLRLPESTEPLKTKTKACEKLSRFKGLDFYTNLAQVATQYRNQESNTLEQDGEALMVLTSQLLSVRETMEAMALEADLEQTQWLQNLYGPNLFKCPELRCRFFHEGFSTSQKRDAHKSKHQRAHNCTFPGCPASATGFATANERKKHEIDYHQVPVDDDTFPWNGKISAINIIREISQENHAAVEAWEDKWTGPIPVKFLWSAVPGKKSPLRAAMNCSDPTMLEALLRRAPDEILHVSDGNAGHQVFAALLDARKDDFALAFTSSLKTVTEDTAFPELFAAAIDQKLGDLASGLITKCDSIAPYLFQIALDFGPQECILPLLDRAAHGGDADFISNGTSYVCIAICNGHVDFAKYLVGHLGALPTEDSGAALREAIKETAEKSQVEICKYLLEYGKERQLLHDLCGQNIICKLVDDGQADFLRVVLPPAEAETWIKGAILCKHAQSGDTESAKRIVKEGGADINVVDGSGYTPLHHAAQNGGAELVEALASNPGVLLDFPESTNRLNALQLAIMHGHQRIVEILLENAFPPEGVTLRVPDRGEMEIEVAPGGGDIRQLLSDYVAANIAWDVYPYDSSPLLRLCATGSLSMVRSAYRRGPQRLNEPNSRSVTPFLQAVKRGRHKIVRYLLSERCEVDALEHTTAASYSALMSAVRNGDAEMVRILLEEAHVDPSFENEVGETALTLLDPKCSSADQIREDIRDALDMRSVFQDIDD